MKKTDADESFSDIFFIFNKIDDIFGQESTVV